MALWKAQLSVGMAHLKVYSQRLGFGVLINASELTEGKKKAVHGAENVIHDMLIFNVDA